MSMLFVPVTLAPFFIVMRHRSPFISVRSAGGFLYLMSVVNASVNLDSTSQNSVFIVGLGPCLYPNPNLYRFIPTKLYVWFDLNI